MPNLLLFADDAVRVATYTYQGGGDPSADLTNYGPGQSYTRFDRKQRREAFSNNWSGLRSGQSPFLGGVPQIAFASARTQRGEVLPTLLDNSVGIASYPALSAVIGAATRFLLPAALSAGAPLAASFLAIIPAYGLGKAAAQGVRYFKKWGYQLRHIEMGGDYSDTETAASLRLRAVGDMSSALSYSRRWLGNEALFLRDR